MASITLNLDDLIPTIHLCAETDVGRSDLVAFDLEGARPKVAVIASQAGLVVGQELEVGGMAWRIDRQTDNGWLAVPAGVQ